MLSALSRAAALGMLVALASSACFSTGRSEPTYTGTGETPRTDGALKTASQDLGCPLKDLRIEAETVRRYVNETAFRYVIEGCGERAGYVESCDLFEKPQPGYITIDGSLACRFILVTRMSLAAPRPHE